MRRSYVLGPLAALVVGGCATRPPYAPPSVALAASFRNSALQPSGTVAADRSSPWWTSFNDPILERMIGETLGGSLDIEIAAARLQQATAGVRAARAASAPLLGGGGSAAIQRQSLQDPTARIASHFPGYARTAEQYGLDLAASWEIDLFGSLAAGRRAARADAAVAEAELAGARLTVTAEIATAYIDARELSARLAIARNRVGTLCDLERLVRLRYAHGTAARLEVDQVTADLATTRSAIPALQAALEAAFHRIDLLAGRTPGFAEDQMGSAPIPSPPFIDVAATPAALLFRRPDVVAAERAVASADARTAEALADRYPKLTIAALAGVLSGGTSTLLTASALQTSASAGLSGPVLDFGRTGAAVDRARARTREAAAAYRMTVLRAAGEAEDGFSALGRRQAQAAELDRSVTALVAARDASRRAYQSGAVSLIEALDAERRLQEAQDSAATARADSARAAVATFRALGGTWRAA